MKIRSSITNLNSNEIENVSGAIFAEIAASTALIGTTAIAIKKWGVKNALKIGAVSLLGGIAGAASSFAAYHNGRAAINSLKNRFCFGFVITVVTLMIK